MDKKGTKKGEIKMNFKTISKEEIETMSFDDLAYVILKEKGKKMKIDQIFRIICDELKLSDRVFEEQIGDFFALLATEKRFIQLDKGYWDLRENHTTEINIDELEDDSDDEIIVEDNEENENEENDYYDEIDDSEDDKGEDDLKDLVIIDDNYEESDL